MLAIQAPAQTTAASQVAIDAPAPERSKSLISIDGIRYYVHSVSKGETLSSISRLYGVDVASIVKANPHSAEVLSIGQLIKVPAPAVTADAQPLTPKQQRRLFEVHTVNQGETAYSIAKRYGISVSTLMEDNPGFDPAILSIGQKINIRKKEIGETSAAQIDSQMQEYKTTLNSVSPEFTHHIVEQGETLYSISRKFFVRIDSIQKYNVELLRDGLHTGDILKIPSARAQAAAKAAGTEAAKPVTSSEWVRQGTEYSPRSRWSLGGAFSSDTTDARIASDGRGVINVVMLLPLNDAGQDKSFVEFYNGSLIALEQLKAKGISTHIDLVDVGRTAESTLRATNELASVMLEAHLIIGPVYEESYNAIADFAAERRVPIISPLAPLNGRGNSFTFQVAPPQDTKNAKLKKLFTGGRNIVVISTDDDDPEFSQEIAQTLPPWGVTRFNYSRQTGVTELEGLFKKDVDNVFVVLAANENVIDEILARISSIQTNFAARGIMNPYIKVVGSSKWSRFRNIDVNLFFKLELSYVSNYHADRTDASVNAFNRAYISAFGSVPTLYSYRGYDVTKLFVSAMRTYGRQMAYKINDSSMQLLQVPYKFTQTGGKGTKFVNQEWILNNYKSNYTIELE